ncbi:MAG: hypothetical protein ACREIA_05505 [Opitutaceae bacterium]
MIKDRIALGAHPGRGFAANRLKCRLVLEGAREARIQNIKVSDDRATGRFDLSFDFNSAWYGRSLGGAVLMFKPVMVSRRSALAFEEEERIQPVKIHGTSFNERSVIELPEGFLPSEPPRDTAIKSAFGCYSLRFSLNEGSLEYTRALALRPAILPAAEYAKVREFFSAIATAEQQAVVYERAAPPAAEIPALPGRATGKTEKL